MELTTAIDSLSLYIKFGLTIVFLMIASIVWLLFHIVWMVGMHLFLLRCLYTFASVDVQGRVIQQWASRDSQEHFVKVQYLGNAKRLKVSREVYQRAAQEGTLSLKMLIGRPLSATPTEEANAMEWSWFFCIVILVSCSATEIILQLLPLEGIPKINLLKYVALASAISFFCGGIITYFYHFRFTRLRPQQGRNRQHEN
mmetsp:Transcript_13312/g.20200  ORF Transcript_13312/g.20200 Transcript_13312/m.20200 type:complete len:199 (-) Transcript_13312:191-787(-)